MDYNKKKCGVDMLDSMCRSMSTKAGTRRWPFAVFCNLLDMAAINSWIIYRRVSNSNISRRQFILTLADQLCSANASSRPAALLQRDDCATMEKRVDCRVKANCSKNRTNVKCVKCLKPMCGQCQAKVCVNCEEQR